MTSPVYLNPSGPPETVLPSESDELLELVDKFLAGDQKDRIALAKIVATAPSSPVVWSIYGQCATETIERYAAYRVGYHRGLDALRANGWKGSGIVRWQEESNRGFLLCLLGLAVAAKQIGENNEAERCELFLLQLDPSGVPANDRLLVS